MPNFEKVVIIFNSKEQVLSVQPLINVKYDSMEEKELAMRLFKDYGDGLFYIIEPIDWSNV